MPDSSLPRGATAPTTDDAAAEVVLAVVCHCASLWENGVRLLGNVRATDIQRAAAEGALAITRLKQAGEAPPVVPVDRTVRLQRWRLLPDEPWMEKSISGEWVEFKQVSALLSAPSVSPASVQAPDEATSSPEERCTTCGFTFQCCRIGGCGMQTETPRPVEAPPPPWRELRERLVARAMRGMASADNENYACLSLTVAEWRELDALLSVPSAAAPREGHGLLEPLKAACDRSWSDETPEQIVAIAANALYWRDQEIARLKAALADAPQAQGWQPIETADAPRGGSRDYVLVALIVRGVVHRVSEAAFNGVGWYDKGGKACHWRTHWMPLPPAPAVDPIASVTPEGQTQTEQKEVDARVGGERRAAGPTVSTAAGNEADR
jgi:hypothetical protein